MHGLKKKNWLVVILVVSALAQYACAQNNKVGIVTKVIPDATHNGRTLQAGDAVFEGEELATNKTGRLRVTLNDGSKITLGGESRLKLDHHDSAAQQTSLVLIGGRVRNQVSALTKAGAKYEVRTAVAVAGVIGTDFEVIINPDGSATVYCYSGQVSVTSLNGLGSVTLGPGQAVTISPTQLGTPYSFNTTGAISPGGVSGAQIAGISLGAAAGAVAGAVVTTENGPSAPSPTPAPVQVTIQKPAASAAANLHPAENALSHSLAASLLRQPSAFTAVQSHMFAGLNAPTRNWFQEFPPATSHNHVTEAWIPHVFVKKPLVGGAVFALKHFQPAAIRRETHIAAPQPGNGKH